jgi:hypothetical protein
MKTNAYMTQIFIATLAVHQLFCLGQTPVDKPPIENLTASSQNYSVFYQSKKIGTLTASKTVKGKVVNYALISDVKVNVVKDYLIVEKINEEFKEDKLHSSIHTRHVNAVLKANNKAVRTGNYYKVSSDNKHVDSLTQWILHTTLTLYFKEPTDKQIVYSQNYQKLIAIKKVKDGVYELPLPNGKKATYHYTAGKLKMLESSSFFGDVQFVLN